MANRVKTRTSKTPLLSKEKILILREDKRERLRKIGNERRKVKKRKIEKKEGKIKRFEIKRRN